MLAAGNCHFRRFAKIQKRPRRAAAATHSLFVPLTLCRRSAIAALLILSGCASTPVPTGTPIDGHDAAASFDQVWTLVEETDVDPAHEGVDWRAAREAFRPRAEACRTREELRKVLSEMLERLGRSHYGILPEGSAVQRPSEASDATLGLDLRVIQDRVVVTGVERGGAADAAGIRVGWIVDRVKGQSAMAGVPAAGELGPMARYARDASAQRLDAGAPDEAESWVLLGVDGGARELLLQRAPRTGTPTQIGLLRSFQARCDDRWLGADELRQAGVPTDRRVGLIRFNVWMPTIAADIDAAVDRHRGDDGVILDLRGNPGGVGAMAMGVAGHFLTQEDSLGTMRTRDAALEFKANPRRSTADGRSVEPFSGPLVILVDPLAASTSEIFAAGLQGLGRAQVIGRTSAGAALPAQMRELPSGDGLLFAFADFTRPDDRRIEGVGVVPDQSTGTELADWQGGTDPDLMAAARWIGGGARGDRPSS
jgi:carboxyl-terminal processing protease